MNCYYVTDCEVAYGAVETMSSSPAGSLSSGDTGAVSTCGSSSEESLETAEGIASSTDDDGELAHAEQPTHGRKRVRRSQNWQKNVRKRRRNAGKRYLSDTTKKMVKIQAQVC